MTGLEGATVRSVKWLGAGLVVTPLLLALPAPHSSTLWVSVHLIALVMFGLGLAMALVDLLDMPWFSRFSPTTATLASAASLVALATGAVALVTLPSSAALRLEPSLQFLQLLSALDIAWAAGATAIGATLLWGRRIGWIAGIGIVAVCVWSVVTYLEAVGYTPAGGWVVDGDAMWRYILPFDLAAAVIAITTLTLGARRRARQPDSGLEVGNRASSI